MKKLKIESKPNSLIVELKNYIDHFKTTADRWRFSPPNVLFIFVASLWITTFSGYSNDLSGLGYSLIPAPQKTLLTGQSVFIDQSWGINTSLDEQGITLKRLRLGAGELHQLNFNETGTGKIILKLVSEPIMENLDSEQAKQAYRIEIEPNIVRISGNTEWGLFYGVQSLLQLLRPTSNGSFKLPEGTITDWPSLNLRVIHWDTKHHQDHIETLKRYIDWAAFFKVNAIAFEMEDKYEYPSHPIIGAPGAFTKSEMHELTSYALERYIQLIPNVQAPSHMTFVLKHKEFEHLQSDESNYHICMCDEEAMQLIFDMYQDMIDATPGVKYFFASTDEVYYAGICGKCKDEYNEINRSQIWVDYVNRVHKWMKERDREVIAWVEYPLLTEHITQLPSGLIDGIMTPNRDAAWIENQNKAGIKQLSYSSMQGAEHLFPNYFPTEYKNNKIKGRLIDASNDIPRVLAKGAKLTGTFAAAWDDAGLHNETFWLGWAIVTQYGWSNGKPTIEQSITDFMNIYYGYNSPEMIESYRLLQEGARFYEDLWDQVTPSKERNIRYGSSYGKGIGGAYPDPTLEMPSLPSVDNVSIEPIFRLKYGEKLQRALKMSQKNARLIDLLSYSLFRVERNQYNIEVLLSIAYLQRYTINTALNLAKVEDYLIQAGKTGDSQKAVSFMIEAHGLVGEIIQEEKNMWSDFTDVWYKTRFKEGRSVDGRNFVHVYDDVKDHFADRRLGLEYMLAPFERMKIEEWQNKLGHIIENYAKINKVSLKGLTIKRLED
ncbi:glycoside hydrolase family 20 zincin-like fold domain-containing protein [Arenibacter sp. S6351L]|uniref:glycoside hydrolase family 20 zincin-like fold domain-containing protein n=1 Tax=Arenibacter sp. S6351L TaxID=2926407 RepID=UPI001FF23CA0|nr:glycoside hydrolase family 20 zincin-like fold domain-containing protein [Arenibacter sp. S6351L]MCK0135365.1 beta-N-acetylhexosaminidase [Arenibacter sp. S6351L]